jgi:low temperature requirement protein LtrA
MTERWDSVLRKRGEDRAPVTTTEVFFDLVYALAITQLTEHLLIDLTPAGAGRSLLMLLAVWWTWNYTAWFTNYFDPDKLQVRLLLMVLMLASLVMSGALPKAFGEGGLPFAAAYVAIQIIRTAYAVIVLGRHALGPVFQRALIWWSATSLLWLAGGIAHEQARLWLWSAAVLIDLLGMLSGFPAPRLGRSRTADYTISGEHMAERCGLFVMMALGESIVITGQNFDRILHAPAAIVAFVTAFASSVALWATYFNWDAETGRAAIAKAADPGRLGVSAFSYFHIPILAGIVMSAAADALTITHPLHVVTFNSAALIIGGPALFLAGSALYGREVGGKTPARRLWGVAALALLAPASFLSSQLAALIAATAVVLMVAAWDMLALRSQPFRQEA